MKLGDARSRSHGACAAIARAGRVARFAADTFGALRPGPISLVGRAGARDARLTDGPDPIVVDEAKAIALGKALFWDVNVGSDGMACASCHFHAGADAAS